MFFSETFLATGNDGAYAAISHNANHALRRLNATCQDSILNIQMKVPELMRPNSQTAKTLFPWRRYVLTYTLRGETEICCSNFNFSDDPK